MDGLSAKAVEQIDGLLERVRQSLQAEGGDIELIEVKGDTLRLALRGRCAESLASMMMLKLGLERALREMSPGFGNVVTERVNEG